jgi:hypothetical protein
MQAIVTSRLRTNSTHYWWRCNASKISSAQIQHFPACIRTIMNSTTRLRLICDSKSIVILSCNFWLGCRSIPNGKMVLFKDCIRDNLDFGYCVNCQTVTWMIFTSCTVILKHHLLPHHDQSTSPSPLSKVSKTLVRKREFCRHLFYI